MRICEMSLMPPRSHHGTRVLAGALLSGWLLFAPAAWAATNTTTYTTSTRTTNHYTTANVTQQVNTFLVELKARMQGGAYLFDQTYNVAFSDPTVQAALEDAIAADRAAGIRPIADELRLREHIEDLGEHFARDAHAIVDHLDIRRPLLQQAGVDRAADRGKFLGRQNAH